MKPKRTNSKKAPQNIQTAASAKRHDLQISEKLAADPEFAAAYRALLARDEAVRSRREKIAEMRETSVELSYVQKAERLLRFVLEDWESYGELEALVYLASRGHVVDTEIKDVVQVWKNAERRSIQECAKKYGAAATDIERHSIYQLNDFWFSDRGLHDAEATLLRVVEWCGIEGYEPWWRRFAKESKENILLGGPEPRLLAIWLVDMCRSNYALRHMPEVLKLAFDVITLTSSYRQVPWTFGHQIVVQGGQRDSVYDDDLEYAAAVAWCATRISGNVDPSLVQAAVATLAKNQLPDGAWPSHTGSNAASIETTALAIHALHAHRNSRSDQMLSDAASWLLSTQDPAGYWSEETCRNPTYLTVLVLDALELANGSRSTTFGTQRSTQSRATGARPIRKSKREKKTNGRRFQVAFSFPGDVRRNVKSVTAKLSTELGDEGVFYDNHFKSELARISMCTCRRSMPVNQI
jgi:hypothetical protein